MRVISGKYKNQKLKSVSTNKVRPTSALVKKSVFEMLSPLNDKKILDLYSGIGSLGIESLSRGASNVTFVEKDKKVFKVLSDNVCSLCDKKNFQIINSDVNRFFMNNHDTYDIIFADPPYRTISFNDLKLKISKLLNNGGIFCMEKEYEKHEYTDVRIKNYGKTQILIWQKIEK